MRDIKFRAWSRDYKKLFTTNEEQNLDLLPIWIRNPDAYDLMQFTGLHDKNGREIYEGDVLVGYDGELITSPVEFIDGAFVLHKSFVLRDYVKGHGVEVIGNIYENPELLDNPTTP